MTSFDIFTRTPAFAVFANKLIDQKLTSIKVRRIKIAEKSIDAEIFRVRRNAWEKITSLIHGIII